MSKTIKARNPYWDNVKFLLIAFVVIGHFIDYLTGSNRLAQAVYIFLYSFHMPMFLFVSGLFLRYDDNHKLRVDRVIYYIIIGYAMKFGLYLVDLIAGGDPDWSWFTTPNAPWYMFVTAGYLILVYIIKNINPKIVLPVSIVVSLAAGYFNFIGDFLCLSKFLVFFPFFYTGYCLTPQQTENFLNKKAVKAAGITVTVIFGIICLAFTDYVYQLRPVFASRYSYSEMEFPQIGILLRIMQYFVAAFMIMGICAVVPKKHFKFFTGAGSRTIPIYFIHYFVARVFAAVDLQTFLVEKFSYFGVVILMILAVAVACVLAVPIFDLPFKFIQNAVTRAVDKLKIKIKKDNIS